MKQVLVFFSTILFMLSCISLSANAAIVPHIKASNDEKGLAVLSFEGSSNNRNYIDDGKYLGQMTIRYQSDKKNHEVSLKDMASTLLLNTADKIQVFSQLPGEVRLYQTFSIQGENVFWDIEFANMSNQTVTITDLSLPVPVGSVDRSLKAFQNVARHFSLNGDASFWYWSPIKGQGNNLLMTTKAGTSIEYATFDRNYFIHSMNSVDRVGDTWRFPSSSKTINARKRFTYGFKFSITDDNDKTQEALYENDGMVVKAMPGMVVTPEMDVYLALRTKLPVNKLTPEHPTQTKIEFIRKNEDNHYIYKFKFARLGENMISVDYGDNRHSYLDFFITEPIETLIKKRSRFIVEKQQHRDTTKWYNGLYSLWDMKKSELLSPDYHPEIPWDFMVGGSDDSSNANPIYVSEKNVVYPDKKEIASLEYYEKNFVWGKLQRTDKEYPYPYGIYGSENWYRNRSGNDGSYEDGGSGKGRMWRTFDYTTHFAIYYNLYVIAKDNPEMVSYLDATGYLERAYRTAMAFFEVPYNILMGSQWTFHGWTDWAYKQGNFHERYILDIIKALQANGRTEDAAKLQREWEKKVTYMIYEDPWPFGSEMYIDRTAFESSYYVAEYAKEHAIEPQEQFWYDKNEKKWYSYTGFDTTKIDQFMQNQLDANLALRSTFEPGYFMLGTAWTGDLAWLDYMTQMGGVAILDYGYKFSDNPAKFINYGYNSLLASWALVNTGNKETGYGYWFKGEQNDGAAGQAFSAYQHSQTYAKEIKTDRLPWRYDAEIGHGLTGGIHGAGIYVVNDPVFGEVCYGGNLTANANELRIIPLDGVRRRIYFSDLGRLSIETEQDGFAYNSEIILQRTGTLIRFTLENRSGKSHDCAVNFSNLSAGNYRLTAGNYKKGNRNCSRSDTTKDKYTRFR
ncbi:hypothetical protein AGMMS49982_18470 [Bacteroidia bacterium]|nr:hypothetical protein AGMMS49982_18470 [Bacteroidia bacterium]